MRRDFTIEEVMLDGASGEVRGSVEIDPRSGQIERIDCESFSFWVDATDQPTILTSSQRNLARQLVERVLEADSEIFEAEEPLRASAERFSPSSKSTQVLADYLSHPQAGKPQPGRKIV